VADDDGRVVLLIAEGHDITERKREEADHARLAAVVESAEDAIIGYALDGTITDWNRGAERLYGHTAAELIGQSFARLVPPELQDELPALLARLATGERVEAHETIRVRKGGQRIEVSLTLSPIEDDRGRVVGAAVIARDISERMRAERFQSALISSVSHDLQTPLVAIKQAASSLLDREVDWQSAERDELLQTIDAETDRLTRFVSQLLAISRIEGHVLHLQREWHDVGEIVAGVARHLDPAGERVHVQLPDLIPLAYVDYLLVEQVVSNLIENALKYSSPTTPVEVTAGTEAELVVITIADRGAGVTAGEATRIYEKFYRGESRATAVPGTGLGLAVARGFAQAHGGDVRYSPRPGGGSVFAITLPIAVELPERPSR
jgi:PAS domain S-box-containing protein